MHCWVRTSVHFAWIPSVCCTWLCKRNELNEIGQVLFSLATCVFVWIFFFFTFFVLSLILLVLVQKRRAWNKREEWGHLVPIRNEGTTLFLSRRASVLSAIWRSPGPQFNSTSQLFSDCSWLSSFFLVTHLPRTIVFVYDQFTCLKK